MRIVVIVLQIDNSDAEPTAWIDAYWSLCIKELQVRGRIFRPAPSDLPHEQDAAEVGANHMWGAKNVK